MNRWFRTAITAALLSAAPAFAQPAFAQTSQPQGQQSTPPPATPAKLSSQDQSFLQKAAEAATSDIKLGQLAVDKASSPAVKQFGQQAVSDFGKARNDLDKIAGDLKWIAPDHMSQDAAGRYDDLWQRHGKDFDSTYIGAEISSHQGYVPLFEAEADKGTDRQLAIYAQTQLPMLRAHLDTAKEISQKAGH